MIEGFSISDGYRQKYPNVGFGLVMIEATAELIDAPGLNQHKRKMLRSMRRRQNLERITARINTYGEFFESFRQPCPLVQHLHRTINSGFPKYSLLVDAHFMAEMCAGILVAVTDYDRFEGGLRLDVAGAGETCLGMGKRHFITQDAEIVLRDEKEIVCVLCQGADEKTRVQPNTRNVLFYAYGVPGIDNNYLRQGLTIAAETVVEFGGGEIAFFEVF